jgi:uncharacterized protein
MTSELTDADGNPIEVKAFQPLSYAGAAPAVVVSKTQAGQKRAPATLKIQLGLLCNYECSYCNQRFVKHADQTNHDHIEPFLDMLNKVDTLGIQRIEFWGGEPLVYWKILKPLAAKLRARFPRALFTIITNGSLLDREKNLWLDAMGFDVAISHDGPGQKSRGPDPLADETSRAGIMDLYRRLHPQGRISINAMIHRDNASRGKVAATLRGIFGTDVRIGEASVIDPYDDSGLAMSFRDQKEHVEFRREAYNDIAGNPAMSSLSVMNRVREIIDSIANRRPAHTLGQKCNMDRADHLAVDLRGNVLTCQNVSTAARGPNGESHNLGHMTKMENVRMRTSTHWSQRKECNDCPVLQSCKGSCMFLDGPLWEAGCNNAFSDHLPFFAAAIAYITGYLPRWIEGPQRQDRKDVFGLVNGVPQRKVIPIQPVA